MPLASIVDYERLGEHLTRLDAQIDAFATAHGYTVTRRGRYPNRYLSQHGFLRRSIDVSMDMDERGQRFDRFFPDIPYIVWGGAWIDDTAACIRYCSPYIRTGALPFSTLQQDLAAYLHHFHSYLSSVTEDVIRACGTASQLNVGPPISDLPLAPPADDAPTA